MSIHQLVAALKVLCNVVSGSIPRGAVHLLLEVMACCCALLVKLSEHLRACDDPRIAAAHAEMVERVFRYSVREQLRSLIHLESTGAHALDDADLSALRAGNTDFTHPAKLLTGRTHYRDTAEFTAAWLGLNYHEAAARLASAHLVVARRHMDGRAITPRFARLAELFATSAHIDPRRVARAARALNDFEPADTCFEGTPLDPTARLDDGQLVEDRAAQLLTEPDLATSEKRLRTLIAAERKARKQTRIPLPGLYYKGQVGGLDRYEAIVGGGDAETFRSLVAQADNPRTDAGKSAREANNDSETNNDPEANNDSGANGDQGSLFESDAPMPDWARGDADANPDANGDANGAANGETGDAAPHGSSREQATQGSGSATNNSGPRAERREYRNPQDAEPDLRGDGDVPVPRRRLNALMSLLRRTSDPTATKTVSPRIGIHLKVNKLEDLKDPKKIVATTDHGVRLDPAEASQHLCGGEIYRVVFGPKGQPLDVGRLQRFFTEAMKRAAFARDYGCIVPGCTAPPEMIEYHHDQWWERGGKTSLDNCSCLCRAHHHAVHAGLLTLVKVRGLAYIKLPRHLDPSQTPRRNTINLAA